MNLLDYNRRTLADFFTAHGEKPFRATQVLAWIHRRGACDFAAMTDIAKGLRTRLQDIAQITPPEIAAHEESHDGTHKWLFRLADGLAIETVYIPDGERHTLCISSQVGCPLRCAFCATGAQGFTRNLSIGEIIGQVWAAQRWLSQSGITLRNVVLMGMGEPLLNFEHVCAALEILLDDWGYGLSWRHITLSTVGIIPALERLRAATPVSLALSLHAADDALRSHLVPLNRKYPLTDLIAACHRYVNDNGKRGNSTHRYVTFEYVMLDGINDSPAQARDFARLLRGIPSKINLIPFNPFPGSAYRRSPQKNIERFRDILLNAGLITITRKTRGADISAACGQLVGQVSPNSSSNSLVHS